MKKFSNITNQKVGEEPKKELKKFNEEDIFKAKVVNLMEDFLKIQTYGPIDRYLRAGNIKISGKETFLDCLLYTSPSPRDRQKSRMPSSA